MYTECMYHSVLITYIPVIRTKCMRSGMVNTNDYMTTCDCKYHWYTSVILLSDCVFDTLYRFQFILQEQNQNINGGISVSCLNLSYEVTSTNGCIVSH